VQQDAATVVDREPSAGDASESSATQPDSITRGFLFSDLRGYTAFVETHGATTAATLLSRYRELARTAIARFGGAEIKTEGDSFYVVFSSVSSAVRCGLTIAADAASVSLEHPDQPIRVGIGIHAGETVEMGGGYVGSPVNIAARICAQAAAGEVLVSETVRALTQSLLPVRFERRGRRQLKGIAESIALFAVLDAAPGVTPWASGRPRRLRGRWLLPALLGAALIAAGTGFVWWSTHPAGLPPGTWTVGLDMPLTGIAAALGQPMRNAAQLAIDDANREGGIVGSSLTLEAYDDAGSTPSGQDPDRGAANAISMIADPRTIAVVGPSGSPVGYAMLPLTNEAGLLQCSPSTSLPELTKPRYGALDLRSARPNDINYVRLAPSDDVQAPALASFAFRDLGTTTALVIDDGDVGRDTADGFAEEYASLGGRVTRRVLNAGADPMTVLPIGGEAAPDVVFFAGFTDTGGAQLRLAMGEAGLGSLPFLSWDGLFDGSGTEDGSFIQRVGVAALGSYIAHASLGPPKASFVDAYRSRYRMEPDEYAAATYACVEVIGASLGAIAASGPSPDGLREALRAYVVDPTHRYQTVLGTIGFDANGDSIQQFVTFYRVDPSAEGGAGDWVIEKQQDFGPAR
jgi:branched-chain amino acid transport system substrate-binding protein